MAGALGPFETQDVSFDPDEVSALPRQEQWGRYIPDWVVQAPAISSQMVRLAPNGTVELLQLRPREAFRLTHNVHEQGGRQLLARAGTILVRAPGPLNAACEMLRQPGFERRSCLVDDDLDGKFDRFFRRIDTSMLLMAPAQSPQFYRKLTIKALQGQPAYAPLDEDADLPPIRFQLRYTRNERRNEGDSENLLRVCMLPYESDLPTGEEHFGRDCLATAHALKDRQLPFQFAVFGNSVLVQTFEGGELAIELRHSTRQFTTKLFYDDWSG